MDRDVKQVVWPAQAISDSVSNLLSAYSLTPDVESISTTTSEDTHLLVQADTDLRFVRRLARRYGFWFWVTTATNETTTAHFKRPALAGTPALTLTINNATPNVSALDLDWDVERPNATIANQLGLRDKGAIDGHVDKSPLRSLGKTPLSDIAAARKVQIVAPVDVVGDLQARSEGALIEAGWFVKLRGETSARALGGVLRTHSLVAVAGLGSRHSGTYLVSSVRHVIDRTAHKMEFELLRNAWGAS
jgi:phage protein D